MAKKSNKTATRSGSSATRLDSDFNKFWSRKVDLNSDIKKQRADIFAKLGNQLSLHLPNSISIKKVLLQGSADLRTSIAPDYDADISVVMKPGKSSPSNFDYFDSLFKAICRAYGRKGKNPIKGLRAITTQYGDSFHIDIVPCVQRKDGIYVCDVNGSLHKTNSEGHWAWLDTKDKFVRGYNLRKTIQLLKYLRDKEDKSMVKSVVITTMLGHLVHNQGRSAEKGSKYKDLPTTFTLLLDRLSRSLQGQRKAPNIRNPAKGERFSSNWDPNKYDRFKSMVQSYSKTALEAYKLGYKQNDYNQSLTQWRKLFGPQFGDIS